MVRSRTSPIVDKLTQKPLDSKKAIYALIAAVSVLLVFVTSAILILLHADVARDIVELANIVVVFFGAIATTLLTGQAVTDWKCVTALQSITEDTNEEAPEEEVNDRIYKPKYFDDDRVF
jgi:hypothetical protein